MCDKMTAVLSLALTIAAAGCGGDSESRSHASADMATLLPVRVPEYKKDKGLIAAAAGPEEAAAPQQAAAEKPADDVQIDVSSPNAAVESLLRVARAGSADRLGELLIEEQAQPAGRILELVHPVAKAAADLKAALDERFPNHGIVIPVSDSPMGMLAGVQGITIRQVDEIDDEHSEAVLEVPNPSGDPSEVKLEVRKVDDAWRIRLPDFQAPEDAETLRARLEPVGQALQAVAEKVLNDGFSDEQAARTAVEAALKGQAPPDEGGSDGGEPQAGGSPAPAAANTGSANTGLSGGGDRRGDIKVTPTAIPVVIDSGGL